MTERITIITRTSENPKQFKRCLKSIQEQTYKDIDLIVIADTKGTVAYCREYGIEPYFVDGRVIAEKHKNVKIENGHRYLPWNLYFNMINSELLESFVLAMDSDDMLTSPTIVEELMNKVKDEDTFYLFKCKIGNRYIPNKAPRFNRPVLNNHSGSGMLYHTKYWADDLWECKSGGDYFAAMKLYNKIPKNKWLNMTVVKAIQAGKGERNDNY